MRAIFRLRAPESAVPATLEDIEATATTSAPSANRTSILLPGLMSARHALRVILRLRAPESAVPATLERTAVRTAPNATNAA